MNPFDRPVSYFPCMEDILYFVYERETIRLKKEGGGAIRPYTDDPILQKYRFCNVRRKHDRMSQWFIRNIFTPYLEAGGQDLWFVAAACRYINWPPTLLALWANRALPLKAEEYCPHTFASIIQDLKDQGLKCFGSAYMIYPGRETGTSKGETVAFRYLLPLVEGAEGVREAVKSNRVENVVTELCKYYGWNTFLAGQVAADLTYFTYELGMAKDLYSWAPMGPGSQRGLNRLLEKPINHNWKSEPFCEQLGIIWTEIAEQLDMEDITLHDVQSVCCEMDKYWRVLNKEGIPRHIYTPETAY